jgi:hypothetical protein
MMANKHPSKWLSAEAAAKRLHCHAGHLRRVCPRLEERGLARFVSGGGRRPHWEIAAEATLETAFDQEQPAVKLKPRRAGLLRINLPGGYRIDITFPACGDGRREAVKRSSKGVQRGN